MVLAVGVVAGTALIAAITAARADGSATAMQAHSELVIETQSGRRAFTVEVADTEHKKMVGLMFRTSLPAMHGMLFPYGRDQEVTMWMRNTYIPLDMVFIRADGIVHRIARNTEPMSEAIIASQGPAAAVLELAGGAAQTHGINPGDRVEHPIFPPATKR